MVDQEQSLQPALRISELETLRGVASWWVVFGHLAFVFSDRLGQIIHNRSAVDLFFIISGFVIAHLLSRSWRGYTDYLLRRFFRIYPMYALSVLFGAATLGLQAYGLQNPLYGGARQAERLAALQSAQDQIGAHLAAHLTMLHGWVPTEILPNADVAILGQGWSISVEWSFYIVAPAMLWALRGSWRGFAAALGLLAALIALRWTPFGDNSANITFAAPWLAAGAAFCFVYERRRRWSGALALASGWGVSAVALMLAAILRSPGLAIWGIVWPVLVGLKGFYAPLLRTLMNWPLAQSLGKMSYSTYLVHMYVIYLAMAGSRAAHLSATASAALIVGASTLGILALSWAGYAVVEMPFINLGRTIAGRFRKNG